MPHSKLIEMTTVAIPSEERDFFVQLGARMAELRKAQGITQVQMAKTLGMSQQTVNSYEVARRRIPASSLPTLARLPAVSVDELLGEPVKQTQSKRGPTPKLQQQIERVSLLPRTKQKFVIDTVIQQAAKRGIHHEYPSRKCAGLDGQDSVIAHRPHRGSRRLRGFPAGTFGCPENAYR